MMAAKEHSPLLTGEHSSEMTGMNPSPNRSSYTVLDVENPEHSPEDRVVETQQLAKERLFDENNG